MKNIAPSINARSNLDVDPAKWLDEYGDYLFKFARCRVRDSAAAEDLVQETFLSALRSLNGFSGASTVRTWLTGILKHKIIDHYRRVAAETTVDMSDRDLFDPRDEHWRESAEPSDWHLSPEEDLSRREFGERLADCLRAMPENLAAVFTLHEIEMLDRDEICELLSVTPANYWVMLHRARLRLRHAFEDRLPKPFAAETWRYHTEVVARPA